MQNRIWNIYGRPIWTDGIRCRMQEHQIKSLIGILFYFLLSVGCSSCMLRSNHIYFYFFLVVVFWVFFLLLLSCFSFMHRTNFFLPLDKHWMYVLFYRCPCTFASCAFCVCQMRECARCGHAMSTVWLTAIKTAVHKSIWRFSVVSVSLRARKAVEHIFLYMSTRLFFILNRNI